MSDRKMNDTKPAARIHPWLIKLASTLWPELEGRSAEQQIIGVGEVLSTIYSLPFLLAGFIWLIRLTDLDLLSGELVLFLLFAALILVFNQLGFFLIIELRRNRYGSADGALTGVADGLLIIRLAGELAASPSVLKVLR